MGERSEAVLICILQASVLVTQSAAGLGDDLGYAMEYPGDVYIAAILPIHESFTSNATCSNRLNEVGVMHAANAFYAAKYLRNHDPDMIKIGILVFDTCDMDKYGIIQALKIGVNSKYTDLSRTKDLLPQNKNLLTNSTAGEKIIGVIGAGSSSTTLRVADVLSIFGLPMVAFKSTVPQLTQFPDVYRTVPSDAFQAKALVQLLLERNWTQIFILYENTPYGVEGYDALSKVINSEERTICPLLRKKLDEAMNYTLVIDEMVQMQQEYPDVHVVLLYASSRIAGKVFTAVKEMGTAKQFLFVGTDGWGASMIKEEHQDVILGAMITHPEWVYEPKFENQFPHMFDNVIFNETALFPNCTKRNISICLRSIARNHRIEIGFMHFVHSSVLAIAYALDRLIRDNCGFRTWICPRLNDIMMGRTDSISDELRKVTFRTTTSNNRRVFRFFQRANEDAEKGRDGIPRYSVMNFQKTETGESTWKDIGLIKADRDKFEDIDASTYEFMYIERESSPYDFGLGRTNILSTCGSPCGPGKVRTYGRIRCCWTCQECPFLHFKESESKCEQCPERHRPSVNRTTCEEVPTLFPPFGNAFIVVILVHAGIGAVATIACALAFLHYYDTPVIKASGRELTLFLFGGILFGFLIVFVIILRPSDMVCGVIRFCYTLTFTMSYAAIFTNTNRISRIFHHGAAATKRIKYVSPLSQVLIVILLLTSQAILNGVWLILKAPKMDLREDKDVDDNKITVYAFCEAFEDHDMGVTLVFPILLLGLTAVYAFRARKCPGTFNETKYIIITTYTTCFIWIAFIPGFFSTNDVVLRTFALCSGSTLNATVMLLCMICPKLYIAVLRPHKNTKDTVMGRNSSRERQDVISTLPNRDCECRGACSPMLVSETVGDGATSYGACENENEIEEEFHV